MQRVFWAAFHVWEELLQTAETTREGMQAGECWYKCVTRFAGECGCVIV